MYQLPSTTIIHEELNQTCTFRRSLDHGIANYCHHRRRLAGWRWLTDWLADWLAGWLDGDGHADADDDHDDDSDDDDTDGDDTALFCANNHADEVPPCKSTSTASRRGRDAGKPLLIALYTARRREAPMR